jgi:gliding motility-associated-like protein
VNCLTLAYTAVNTNDYATISVDGGGTVSVTAVNVGVTGCDQIGPWTCGSGSYGDCAVTVYSTAPFTQVTLTNTGCSSGWVINCSDQVPCNGGGAGGNAGADDFSTVMCGGIIDLNTLVTGSAGGLWTETTSSGQFTPGSGNFDVNGLAPAVYTFEYFVAGSGCAGDDTAFFSVEVVPPADASWTLPGVICSNSAPTDLNLLVTGLAGGTWTGIGVTGNMFDPSSGSQDVTYTVGTTPCDANLMQNIVVTPALSPSWTSPGTICEADGSIDLNTLITGDMGGTWSGTGVSGNMFDPSGLSGNISVTYTIGSAPCVGVDSQDIIVVAPVVTTTGVNISCFGLTDGSVTANVTGGSGNYTYSWDSSPVQTTETATNLPAGTYTVTVTDVDGGCSVTSQVVIVEPAQLNATLNATNACDPNLGVAEVVVSGGVGPFSYSWNNSSSTTGTADDLDSAMHTVVITDGSGCTYTDSIFVQIFPSPNAIVNADTTMIFGNPLLLTAGGGVSYQWTPNYAMDCDTCQSPYINPEETTTYCVDVTDVNNCMNSACVLVSVELVCGEVFVPSAFSPNGDGENELECIYSDCMDSFAFYVYNRWGEKVFETESMNICWDGTWKGKELNSGVFTYVIEGYLINGERISQKGNISLIR